MVDTSDLESRWGALWSRLGVSEERAPQLQPLLQAYSSPGRHYHTLRHLIHCMNELDAMRSQCASADAVESALWYHDAVYDPARKDNEERSADMAAKAMNAAGLKPDVVRHVADLILQTKHAAEPKDADAQVLVDIDLAILGQPPEAFTAYEHAIREEYAHVDELDFRIGRASILQQFLDREFIYSTAPMREKYEASARANLKRSLAALAGV